MPAVVQPYGSAVLTWSPHFLGDGDLLQAQAPAEMRPSRPSEVPLLPVPEGFETFKWFWQGTSLFDQSEESLRVLRGLYTLRRPWEVAEFLRDRPFLANVAIEARIHIARSFGVGTRVLLEVVTDPEAGDQQLMVFIQTKLEAEQALATLDRLDQEWWLKALPKTGGTLCIDLEFL